MNNPPPTNLTRMQVESMAMETATGTISWAQMQRLARTCIEVMDDSVQLARNLLQTCKDDHCTCDGCIAGRRHIAEQALAKYSRNQND